MRRRQRGPNGHLSLAGWAGPTTMAELYLLKVPADGEGIATVAASGKRVRPAAWPVNYILVIVRAAMGVVPRRREKR